MTKLTRNELARLELALKTMRPRTKLWNLLRAELTHRGHWKLKARGDGGNQKMRESTLK